MTTETTVNPDESARPRWTLHHGDCLEVMQARKAGQIAMFGGAT
jgi:hypothetical protein